MSIEDERDALKAPAELPRGMSQELSDRLTDAQKRLWPQLTNFQRLQMQRRAFADEPRPGLGDEIRIRHGEDPPMTALSSFESLGWHTRPPAHRVAPTVSISTRSRVR
jgi:hypothetical protein